jgi:D-threo-aldose 1-dehydrogenase
VSVAAAPVVPGPVMFGAAPIAGLFTPVSAEAAAATLDAAWTAGIRAFDTAPHYGVGVSERRLGSFLAGHRRDEFTVSTKVGRLLVPAAGDVQGDEGFYGIPALTRVLDYSGDGVRRSLEESLERLGLDRVDIVLIHDPDDFMEQAAAEAYPALASLRDQGIVRAIGAGMNSASALAWLAERCDLDCVLVAGRYTLLDRAAAGELFPVCQRRGVAVLAGGVFNSGILAAPDDGTYDYAPPPPAVAARARRMRDACARLGVPLPAAALQFTLRHPAVTAAVVGARTPEEITEDVSYLSTPIPDELWPELEALLHDREGREGALDGDDGGVAAVGDGLAELQAQAGEGEGGEQPAGDVVGGGLDQAEPALADDGGDELGHGRVIEGVREVVARRRPADVGRHVHAEDEGLLDLTLPVVPADDGAHAEVPDRYVIGHGTEASHCSTPAMCTVAQDLAASGSWAASASRMARCSASVRARAPVWVRPRQTRALVVGPDIDSSSEASTELPAQATIRTRGRWPPVPRPPGPGRCCPGGRAGPRSAPR